MFVIPTTEILIRLQQLFMGTRVYYLDHEIIWRGYQTIFIDNIFF